MTSTAWGWAYDRLVLRWALSARLYLEDMEDACSYWGERALRAERAMRDDPHPT